MPDICVHEVATSFTESDLIPHIWVTRILKSAIKGWVQFAGLQWSFLIYNLATTWSASMPLIAPMPQSTQMPFALFYTSIPTTLPQQMQLSMLDMQCRKWMNSDLYCVLWWTFRKPEVGAAHEVSGLQLWSPIPRQQCWPLTTEHIEVSFFPCVVQLCMPRRKNARTEELKGGTGARHGGASVKGM